MTLALLFTVNACGLPTDVIVLLPDEPGSVGKIAVTRDGSATEMTEAYTAFDGTSDAREIRVFTANPRLVETTFAGALASTPRAPVVHIIFFIIGSEEPEPASLDTLTAAIMTATSTTLAEVAVVGHSDAIGDDQENLALSLRRANAVRDALVQGNVRAEAIDISYHGSNNPLVPTPRGTPEPRNRRVEVVIR